MFIKIVSNCRGLYGFILYCILSFQAKSLLKWNILPFSRQSLICNVECHPVGTVKRFLPEEVRFVFFFLHWVKCREGKKKKRLKSISALLNHLQGAYVLF